LKEQTVCFGGHSGENFRRCVFDSARLRADLYTEMEAAVRDGFHTFLSGVECGFDLLCAETVLLMKLVRPELPIRLLAVIPFETQPVGWKKADYDLYFHVLSKCDGIVSINTQFTRDCRKKCASYLVDHSNRLLCYDDGSDDNDIVKYAREQGLQMINLYQKDLADLLFDEKDAPRLHKKNV